MIQIVQLILVSLITAAALFYYGKYKEQVSKNKALYKTLQEERNSNYSKIESYQKQILSAYEEIDALKNPPKDKIPLKRYVEIHELLEMLNPNRRT